MATLCNYTIVVITIFFVHLVYFSVTATTIINNNNGGFSAHLIRRTSPNSPLYRHKNNKVFRRLMGGDMSGYPLQLDPISNGHIMKLSIGTPPSDIYVLSDTGSTLLWTQCKSCKTCYKTKYAMFDPRKSSTYRNITCSERECKFVDDYKPSSQSPSFCQKHPTRLCTYNMTYVDTASSLGVLAKETFTLTSRTGEVVTLEDIVFGCGHLNYEPVSTGNEMGVIGLGRGPMSFVSQIAPHVGGNKFSYCLVPMRTDPKFESKINFGNGSEVLGEGVVSTPLLDVDDSSNYIVAVEGISIGNEFVPFNSTVKPLKKFKMVVDSGSSIGHLPRDIWDRVITQLNKTLDPELKPSIVYNATADKTHYLCFNSMTIPEEPKVAFHFMGGGKLELMAEQIFIKSPQEENTVYFGIGCMDVYSGVDSGLFGANLQGNLLIGYDLDRNVASFKPTNCLN
ncbi:aspartic proteinase CDR1-like [Rosa rugosa]|uniref:aspartic proteinase CDR1-like n=1 Tax=Rosa rugosa TaxID=74645 RepID=UPI002B4139FA|nr:aspartic proteinase CDR1-like [Rosa rugosa]